ncbi:hypothetical protein PMAYCL1PPCAC_05335, partial [Pristionchus mayeri]
FHGAHRGTRHDHCRPTRAVLLRAECCAPVRKGTATKVSARLFRIALRAHLCIRLQSQLSALGEVNQEKVSPKIKDQSTALIFSLLLLRSLARCKNRMDARIHDH